MSTQYNVDVDVIDNSKLRSFADLQLDLVHCSTSQTNFIYSDKLFLKDCIFAALKFINSDLRVRDYVKDLHVNFPARHYQTVSTGEKKAFDDGAVKSVIYILLFPSALLGVLVWTIGKNLKRSWFFV